MRIGTTLMSWLGRCVLDQTSEKRNEDPLFRRSLDKGHVHFKAMLILIHRSGHAGEGLTSRQIVIDLAIDAELAERGVISVERGESAGGQIDVMAGSQHYDTLVLAQVGSCVRIRCCAPTER